MDTITYSAARANLASTMDKVCQDHEPMIITRSGQPSVVMLSLEDFKSLEETSYLLRSPENAIILVTHYQRLLNYIKPDFVHVLSDGCIVKQGGAELALELEEKGYDWVKAATK